MTKPRTRTQKIHRKRRGSRRGFKSRSQRGGGLLDYFGLGDKGESKQSWSDWVMGNNTNQNATAVMQQPVMQQPVMQEPVMQEKIDKELNEYVGGRKRCKRHHKHSRRCKK